MGKQYNQVTQHDRNGIQAMLTERYSKATVAKHLRGHISTIYRELNRNKCNHPRTGKTWVFAYHKKISDKLNNWPRRTLDFATPIENFYQDGA